MNRFVNCKFVLFLFFPFILCFQVWGQDYDSELSKINSFVQALDDFSQYIPHEKVYLHFDNTSYYQGDRIWFKCYVTSAQHQLSELSKTLYVELLNPGGESIDKRILKIENGQCHGDFTLNHLPFYSGFYEVRAYTKYMLNFGDDVIFSRLLPVFDKPKEEGNFEEKKMMRYGRWGSGNYPMKRERPIKGNTVNLRFFPEGGNLIQDVASRVAFEATDEIGNPIEVTGVVMDGSQQELFRITTLHEGRGVFTYTPTRSTGRKDIAEVEYSGKKYRFDMPTGLPQGVVMEVDHLSHSDSLTISLRKNSDTPVEILGLAVLHGGKLQNAYQIYTEVNEFRFKLDKAPLPLGVSQIVLFNGNGEILCDRLVFTCRNDEWLDIKAKTEKATYRPYESVDLKISVADRLANPVFAIFSLSVRDGENEVENNNNILTELLLMSEIKGYVCNPAYYFENDDEQRRAAALDVLLMVQGWRRYSWNQMSGIENFEIKNLPEQGIEIHGQIVTFGLQQIPKPEVDVNMLLQKREVGNEKSSLLYEQFVTDQQGGFSFVADVEGRWDMTLTVAEKGKQKNLWIVLDRVFSPEPKKYRYADLQVSIVEKNVNAENIHDETSQNDDLEDDMESFFIAYRDSLSKLDIDEKVHQIEEVTIAAKRYTKEKEILRNRTTSVAYYDVASEYDNLYDSGEFIGDNIHQLLKNMNHNFTIRYINGDETLWYKNKRILFVVNYEQLDFLDELSVYRYKYIRIQAIKSIYINENLSIMCQYADPRDGCFEINKNYSCVVFIETYPNEKAFVQEGRGTRKTWLDGYSLVKEFYSPNYLELPPEPNDYRRTLYWNPMVTTDENGNAKIQFYNNSRCTDFRISAETVTSQGKIGIYQR